MLGSVQFILAKQVSTHPGRLPRRGARVTRRVAWHVPPHSVACANEADPATIATNEGTSFAFAHSVAEVIVSVKADKAVAESQSMSLSSPGIASKGNPFTPHGLMHSSAQPVKEPPVVLRQSRVKA